MAQQRPSLRVLERQISDGKFPEALQTSLQVLQAIDDRFGRLERVDIGEITSDGTDEDAALVLCTRFAAAFGRVLTEPTLAFTALDYERLLLHHRWIDLIFSLSGFHSSDHLLPLLSKPSADGRQLSFEGANYLRLLAMLSLNSRVGLDFNDFWQANKVATALAFMQYVSSRYVFSPRAFEFRERLLEWLPAKLDEVKLGSLTLSRLPEIYMHCSYAITDKKHGIKAALMKQMRRACLEAGVVEVPAGGPPPKDQRPTAVIVCEHFVFGHSMYRTHSLSVKALRERFDVVGVVYRHQVTPPITELFDETLTMPDGDFLSSIRLMSEEIRRRNPAFVLFPSVGMTPHAIALASVRLAPIQIASYGHAASTMSPSIDYLVLPNDFAGSTERFSEKVLALPPRHMPFRPRQLARPIVKEPPSGSKDGKVRVAIPASTMKLNPRFFDVLGEITALAKTPFEFQFFPLAATGLPYIELSKVIRRRLPKAVVFPEMPHDDYLAKLGQCDLFLCPFPYGNTNSIVDSILVGLPGINLDGPEPHSHIDAGLFERIGFPPETTTHNYGEYANAAVKMIDDAAWRLHCREIAYNCDIEDTFFTGDASQFCKAIANVVWPAQAAPREVEMAATD